MASLICEDVEVLLVRVYARVAVIVALLLWAGTAIGGAEAAEPVTGGVELEAETFVSRLAVGDFERAAAAFGPRMKAAMPPKRLEQAWQSLQRAAGPFVEQVGRRRQPAGTFDVVLVTCRFERAVLDVKVVFGPDGRIGGLWFVPHQAVAEYRAPAYVDLDAFHEEEVTVGEGEWTLPGTLSLPRGDGPFPGLVLVHGSGPNDRDETVGANKPFRDLAWGLASRGIAVLRYEKRTRAHPQRCIEAMAEFTVDEEVVDDALAAADLLRHRPEVDAGSVFVLGHSLGGALVPRIAARSEELAGFIIMAGAVRPVHEAMLAQLEYISRLDEKVTDGERQALESIQRAGERIEELRPEDGGSEEALLGAAPAYWLDLRDYDPPTAAARMKRPVLLLQGGRDYQVTVEGDFRRWQRALEGGPNVGFRLYPELNHLFVAGEDRSAPEEYARPGHVAERVVRDVAEWIESRR